MKLFINYPILGLLTIFISATNGIFAMQSTLLTKGQQLINAAKEGDLELIKALHCPPISQEAISSNRGYGQHIKQSINPNACDNEGLTPLIYAVCENHLPVIRYLIEEMHADINIMNKNRVTALQVAAVHGSTDIIKYLVNHKDLKRSDAAIALNLARERNHNKAVQCFEEHIGALPVCGDLAGMKSIFYNDQVNNTLKLDSFEILAYFTEPISIGIKHVYQVRVMRQDHAPECTRAILKQLAEKFGDTEQQHYDANPIYGGTCSYHALKNALIGLMILYDYDKLVEHFHSDDDKKHKQITNWLTNDVESLLSLTKDAEHLDAEHFMESVHAKTAMIRPSDFYRKQELINVKASLSETKSYIARHLFDDYFGSIMSKRYQIPLYALDNSVSHYDVFQINKVIHCGFSNTCYVDSSNIPTQEHPCANNEILYQNCENNNLSKKLIQIGAFDLLQQIALFRSNKNYRHAFVLSLNSKSNDGFDIADNGMHAVTVIIDKHNSIVNEIIFESNNIPELALKDFVFVFLSLFTDEKAYPINEAYNSYLLNCASHKSGICIETEQCPGLPSFESLVKSYIQTYETCVQKKQSDDAHYALYLFLEIQHYCNRAKMRAEDGTDTKTFDAIHTILLRNGLQPDDILSKEMWLPSYIELNLYDLINKVEDYQLVDKMHEFIRTGNALKVQELLKLGVNPNAKELTHGRTALIEAAINGKNDIVILLCEHGADIEITDNQNNTPLMQAAQSKCFAIVEYLIQKKACINKQNINGKTALMQAAEWGCFDIIKCLINQGADVDIQDNSGKTALMQAAKSTWIMFDKKLEIIKFLIEECKADYTLQTKNGSTLLIYSASAGAVDVLEYLIKEKEMSIDLKTFIDCIVQSPALMYSTQFIDYLITNHNFNCKNNNESVMIVLTKAITLGCSNIIDRLLKHDCGLNINDQDNKGWTALMHAANNGWNQCIQNFLKMEDIDLHIKNKDGQTALDLAYEKGFEFIVQLLGGNPKSDKFKPYVSKSRLGRFKQEEDPFFS